MTKFLSKYAFWIIQVFSWAAFALLTLLSADNERSVLGKFLFYSSMFLSGFITTSLLRYILKKYIPLTNLNLKKILLMFGAVVVASFLLLFFLYLFGFLSGFILDHFSVSEEEVEKKESFGLGIAIAIAFVMMVFWISLYYGIRLLRKYNEARINRLKIRDKIKQEQLNTLKGHINPKFLVETLHKIKVLMLKDVSLSRERLTELSELLRYSLTKNNINKVCLEEELEIVKKYTNLCCIDSSNSLEVNYVINPNTLNLEVPPMILLSVMELFIKHGQDNLKERKIDIHATKSDSRLQIKIISNIKMISSEERDVLENRIRQRLKLLFKQMALINHVYEGGQSVVTVKVPLLSNNEPKSE